MDILEVNLQIMTGTILVFEIQNSDTLTFKNIIDIIIEKINSKKIIDYKLIYLDTCVYCSLTTYINVNDFTPCKIMSFNIVIMHNLMPIIIEYCKHAIKNFVLQNKDEIQLPFNFFKSEKITLNVYSSNNPNTCIIKIKYNNSDEHVVMYNDDNEEYKKISFFEIVNSYKQYIDYIPDYRYSHDIPTVMTLKEINILLRKDNLSIHFLGTNNEYYNYFTDSIDLNFYKFYTRVKSKKFDYDELSKYLNVFDTMFPNVSLLNQQNPICKHKIKVELFLENTSNIIHSFDVIIIFSIYFKDILKEVIRQLNTNQHNTLYYKIIQDNILLYNSENDEKTHIYCREYKDDIPVDKEHFYMHIYQKTDDEIYNISNNYIIDETIDKISFQIFFNIHYHSISDKDVCKVKCSTIYESIEDPECRAGMSIYFHGYSSDEDK